MVNTNRIHRTIINGNTKQMKTNYEHQRTTEGREVIVGIARYATKGMMRTKQKSTHYAKILDACKRDLQLYGFEND